MGNLHWVKIEARGEDAWREMHSTLIDPGMWLASCQDVSYLIL